MPPDSACKRGAGFPCHSNDATDFTTTPPSADKSMYAANSSE